RRAAAVDPGGGAELLADGGQRGAVAVADHEAAQQFVAEVPGVTQFDPIAFAGVAVVMQEGPVVDHQGVAVAEARDGGAGALQQGLHEARQGDVGVAVEAPGGLGGGEGPGDARPGAKPGGHGLQGREVLLDELEVAFLEPNIDIGDWVYIPSLYARHLCRYSRCLTVGVNPTARLISPSTPTSPFIEGNTLHANDRGYHPAGKARGGAGRPERERRLPDDRQ